MPWPEVGPWRRSRATHRLPSQELTSKDGLLNRFLGTIEGACRASGAGGRFEGPNRLHLLSDQSNTCTVRCSPGDFPLFRQHHPPAAEGGSTLLLQMGVLEDKRTYYGNPACRGTTAEGEPTQRWTQQGLVKVMGNDHGWTARGSVSTHGNGSSSTMGLGTR